MESEPAQVPEVPGVPGVPEVPGNTQATDDESGRDATSTSLVPWVRGQATRRPKNSVTVVAVVLLAAASIVGIFAHYQQQRSVAPLNAERARLRTAESLLQTAQSQLAAVQSQSDAAGRSLASATNQLAADQAKLAHAQAEAYAQGVSISQLDTCLSAVMKSLNQISLGDQTAAAATLSGGGANCQNAEPSGP